MSPELEKILAKIKNDETLTDDEERLYMKEVFEFTDSEVDRIMTITANKDPDVFID